MVLKSTFVLVRFSFPFEGINYRLFGGALHRRVEEKRQSHGKKMKRHDRHYSSFPSGWEISVSSALTKSTPEVTEEYLQGIVAVWAGGQGSCWVKKKV